MEKVSTNQPILITGATGFLGAHVALEFLRSGYHVKGTYRSKSSIDKASHIFSFYPDGGSLFSQIDWVNADLLCYDDVLQALSGISVVVHTAAEVSFNPRFKSRIVENNTRMAAYIVDACLENRVDKLCHISSIAAIGSTYNGDLITEDTKFASVKNQSGYSISKFYSEMEVWRGINAGLNAQILNPSVILGPGDWKTGSSTFILSVAKGLSFYTKGVTGFVDVRDVALASRLVVETDTEERQHIISAENIDYQQLLSSIAAGLGKKAPKYQAHPIALGILAKLSGVVSLVTGSEPLVTPQSARSAWKRSFYDGSRFAKLHSFTYTPISDCVNFACRCYLNDNGKVR